MKSLLQLFILLSLASGLSACKAMKALDATIAMNKKMDETNRSIQATNDAMQAMKNEMLSAMGKTNQGIDLQKIAIALDHTVRKDHVHPSQAMAGAKTLVEAATANQLIDIALIQMKAINGELIELKLEEKVSLAYSLNAIAYSTPPEKIAEIITTHIQGRSNREDVAYAFLAYRAQLTYLMLVADLLKPYGGKETDRRKTPHNYAKLDDIVNNVVLYHSFYDLPFANLILHDSPKETEFSVLRFDSRKDTMLAIKYAIENWLDCARVKENPGRLEEILTRLEPYFKAQGTVSPQKKCN